jgi:hypothetical protein
MQVGTLPKKVSQERLIEKLQNISNSEEQFVFACDVVEGLSKHSILAISNERLTFLDTDLNSPRKDIALNEIADFKFSWTGLTIDNGAEKLFYAVNPQDKKSLIELNEIHSFVNPDAKTSKELSKAASEEKKRLKKEEQARQEEETRKRIEANLEMCGRVVLSSKLHTFKSKVVLYEKGYVSIGGGYPEKLLAISGNADVTKKSGAGRAAGALLTFGTNLDASTTMRGNVYLTILTDVKSHVQTVALENVSGGENPVQRMKEIVAAGEFILKSLEGKSTHVVSTTGAGNDIASQLAQLASLHQSGALSDQEFELAKAKLLSSGD